MKRIAIVLVFLLALTLLTSLGVWQTKRGLQKADILSKAASEHQDYQTLEKIPTNYKELEYTSAQLLGQWDHKHTFLLDNRIYNGRQGFEILTVFTLKNGQPLLINRGWTEKQATGNIPLPDNPAPTGILYTPKKGYTIGHSVERTASWPKTSLYLDLDAFAQELNTDKLSPLMMVLDAEDPDSLTRIWQPVVISPEKHYAYALQWFGLSIVLLVFGFIWRKNLKP